MNQSIGHIQIKMGKGQNACNRVAVVGDVFRMCTQEQITQSLLELQLFSTGSNDFERSDANLI